MKVVAIGVFALAGVSLTTAIGDETVSFKKLFFIILAIIGYVVGGYFFAL